MMVITLYVIQKVWIVNGGEGRGLLSRKVERKMKRCLDIIYKDVHLHTCIYRGTSEQRTH